MTLIKVALTPVHAQSVIVLLGFRIGSLGGIHSKWNLLVVILTGVGVAFSGRVDGSVKVLSLSHVMHIVVLTHSARIVAPYI